MKCITILRYLCDHIDELPLGVSTRLTITHDVPVLLVQLMESKPWIKTSKNQVFEGAIWKVHSFIFVLITHSTTKSNFQSENMIQDCHSNNLSGNE